MRFENQICVASASLAYIDVACSITCPGFCLSCPRNLHCPRDSTKALVRVRFSVRCSVPESKNGATKVEYTPWLVVGLGNPGSKYHGTRHNVGFEVIDNISKAEGTRMNTIQSKALIGIDSIGDVPILLAKPQTYMNFSGESVYDEMSLPNGVLRLQPKGGHGYDNGFKEVMVLAHCPNYERFPSPTSINQTPWLVKMHLKPFATAFGQTPGPNLQF
ncbi:chloroplastic group IIB intron splicing facilitator CRS2-B, chloroplastic-like [Arachis stenosperma]|uniref:chloroplastic group IIB intron splicing facilitator CRS2-B, chloroplastic-like n=1 Tax=Arachis stenosperma TaxID=217475 RepID=UPI0025ABCBA3|nr:chloroplastic group IIB intron splicing facilitator CRS2-B, chloroplastic-like [Arachis stenosperma]